MILLCHYCKSSPVEWWLQKPESWFLICLIPQNVFEMGRFNEEKKVEKKANFRKIKMKLLEELLGRNAFLCMLCVSHGRSYPIVSHSETIWYVKLMLSFTAGLNKNMFSDLKIDYSYKENLGL